MLKTWQALLILCASLVACDAFRPQFKLQSDIKREFKITQAIVFVMDTTTMLVLVFDDARAAANPKERAAFMESVASYAVSHYQRGRLKGVGISVTAARSQGEEPPAPTFFLPEYHPDGTIRVALLPQSVQIPANQKN